MAAPHPIFQVIEDQMDRLKKAQEKFGDVIPPEKWWVIYFLFRFLFRPRPRHLKYSSRL